MSGYSFDEDGVCSPDTPGYVVARPAGISDEDWEKLGNQVLKLLNDERDKFDGFEGQGRRLYLDCVRHGASPGNVLRWLREVLDSAGRPSSLGYKKALQELLNKAWWKGYHNGQGQSRMGHSAGYEHVDCETDTLGLVVQLEDPDENSPDNRT